MPPAPGHEPSKNIDTNNITLYSTESINPPIVMPYKIKDLMITVLPETCDSHGTGCPDPSLDCRTASGPKRICEGDSMEILDLTPYIYINPPYLDDLRIQLRYALGIAKTCFTQMDAPQLESLKELDRQVEPQTVAQLDDVEAKLESALQEVRRMRSEMAKGKSAT